MMACTGKSGKMKKRTPSDTEVTVNANFNSIHPIDLTSRPEATLTVGKSITLQSLSALLTKGACFSSNCLMKA
jgi:hypothetical protein